jgi:hypothetical protein
MRAHVLLPLATVLLAGCAVASTPGPTPASKASPTATPTASSTATVTPSPTLTTPVGASLGPSAPAVVQGAALTAGPKPDTAACERLIRPDRQAAERIRSAVALNEGRLASDAASVAAAAGDPSAAISPELGIPLTPAEEKLVKDEGAGDWVPLYWWVNYGHPERFGGYWIDRTGGGARTTVAIAPTDMATMTLARCLEHPGVAIQYVRAAVTVATLGEIRDRIRRDADWLRGQGMGWNSLGVRVDIGRVAVGVETPTPEIEAFYRARYGWPILIEQASPAIPLTP